VNVFRRSRRLGDRYIEQVPGADRRQVSYYVASLRAILAGRERSVLLASLQGRLVRSDPPYLIAISTAAGSVAGWTSRPCAAGRWEAGGVTVTESNKLVHPQKRLVSTGVTLTADGRTSVRADRAQLEDEKRERPFCSMSMATLSVLCLSRGDHPGRLKDAR